MLECDTTLLWVLSGVRPAEGERPSNGKGKRHPTLTDAVRHYRLEKDSRRIEGFLPWLKPHGVGGAPWLNEPQIEAVTRTLEAHHLL